MPRRSNLFQDVVGIIHRHMAEGATVEESAMLNDPITGERREVDVVIRSEVAGHGVTVGVEASARSRAATVEWVEQMLGKHKDLPTDKLVLVAQAGFTRQARRRAEAAGAVAIAPEDLAGGEPAFTIVNRLQSIWPKTIALTPEAARVFVRRPDLDGVAWFRPTPDLDVVLDDGEEVGPLIEVAKAVINANFETIAEQIGLANIAEDTKAKFVFQVGPPWIVRVNDEERRLCARYVEGADIELHTIEALEVVGDATITVSEVALTHRRLGEVVCAYGEANISGRDALVLVTEDERGGRMTIRFRPSKIPA